MPGCVSARIQKNAGASLGIDAGKKFTGYLSIAQKNPARRGATCVRHPVHVSGKALTSSFPDGPKDRPE
jgi:hypothetical protein